MFLGICKQREGLEGSVPKHWAACIKELLGCGGVILDAACGPVWGFGARLLTQPSWGLLQAQGETSGLVNWESSVAARDELQNLGDLGCSHALQTR